MNVQGGNIVVTNKEQTGGNGRHEQGEFVIGLIVDTQCQLYPSW